MGFFSDVFGCGDNARHLREERRARQQEERRAKEAHIRERIRNKRAEHEDRMRRARDWSEWNERQRKNQRWETEKLVSRFRRDPYL